MDTLYFRLKTLLGKWQNSLSNDTERENNYFVKDGLINMDKLWYDRDYRVAIILKDQNQGKDANKYWHGDVREYDLSKNGYFFRNLRNILWGITHSRKSDLCYWDAVQKEKKVISFFRDEPFVLIEAKKTPGGPYLLDDNLKHHLDKYGDLLLEEISTYKPNFVICCNDLIFKFIVEHYPEDNLRIFKNHGWVCFDKAQKVFIIHAYHPSDRGEGKSDKEHFEFVMNHFNAVLQELPEAELPNYLL